MVPNEPEVVFDVRQRHKLVIEQTLGKLDRPEDEMLKGEKTFFRVLNTNDEKGRVVDNKRLTAQ